MALPKPERARPKLGNAYVSPSTPLETRLASVWAEVLDLDGVGVEDRFTDLGGHSLAAVRLLAALDEMTGRELPYSVLLDAGTVRELAAVLADGDWAPRWRSLVHVQAGDSRPPLFLVPAAASTSLTLASFAKAMGPQQGVYGFDALGMNGRSEPQRTVEEMAAHYIDEMRQLQPTGPYLIGGRCFGALTAIEMTRQLEADDVEAPLIVVLDSGDLHLSALMPGRSLWRKWHDYGYVNGAALSAIRRNLLFRTRRRYRTVRTRVGRVLDLKAYRQEPGAYVQRVHIQARRRYRPKPVQATMVVYMSQEYAKLGRAEEWRTLAGGEFVIGPSERWAHAGFLDDVENLQQVCPHLRELLRTL